VKITSEKSACREERSIPMRWSPVSSIAARLISVCYCSLVSVCLALVPCLSIRSLAQQGQNEVSTGSAPTPSPSFFDATQFSGAGDACQAISAAFGALPAMGGTVDARGLVGNGTSPLKCSVNPIPSSAKGRLLLSSGTYLAQVPWVIQSNNFSIIGTGASGDTGNNNTIIQACASGQANCGGVVFPSGSALIQMGTSGMMPKTVMRSSVKELAHRTTSFVLRFLLFIPSVL
jgi:hypothetical protein